MAASVHIQEMWFKRQTQQIISDSECHAALICRSSWVKTWEISSPDISSFTEMIWWLCSQWPWSLLTCSNTDRVIKQKIAWSSEWLSKNGLWDQRFRLVCHVWLLKGTEGSEWLRGASVTVSVNLNDSWRRFTASSSPVNSREVTVCVPELKDFHT